MPDEAQTYATHRRWDPTYHFFITGVLAINLLIGLWALFKGPAFPTIWAVVFDVALIFLFFKVRLYALKVQDRVIRLEERLRMAALLQEPLRGRSGELSASQLIALRFASDAEVPGLVEQALSERLSGEEIKKRIKSWRPDTFRV